MEIIHLAKKHLLPEHVGDDDDLPWLTDKDHERMAQEIGYLKQWDDKLKTFRDSVILEFKPQVIDRYCNHLHCYVRVGSYGGIYKYSIIFLGRDGNTETSISCWMDKGKLRMRAKEYVNCPPKERKHWEKFRIGPDPAFIDLSSSSV